jgi:hypothetical protein
MNRLSGSMSPYLQQHAQNPVHWWPWCDEAFAEAKRRDVPILLSVGYASCRWCHETKASRKIGASVLGGPGPIGPTCCRWPANAAVGRRFRTLVYHFVYHRGRIEPMWRTAVPARPKWLPWLGSRVG